MSNAQTTSTISSTTLRPRTKRLISGLSEGDETAPENFDSPPRRINSPVPSPFDSRSASPIPAAHPQRAGRGSSDGAQRFVGNSWGRRAQVGSVKKAGSAGDGALSPTALAGIWGNSWTTLQGLASDFLGNDIPSTSSSSRSVGGSPKSKQKRQLDRLHPNSFFSNNGAPKKSAWGPSAPTSHPASGDIGTGTREERESALRAQKRKDMLTGQEGSYADALGRFKRRLSDDHDSQSMSAPPSSERDNDNPSPALVYLHHVRKDDTLAGITIKYHCSANVLRKANRMWPNDTVQSRQTLVLPVDACAVKGKPLPAAPEATLDLLASAENVAGFEEEEEEEVPTPKATAPPPDTALTNGSTHHRVTSGSASPITSSRRASSSIADSGDPPWHHDSWVQLPGFPNPTEIARLSRRALGYFPPTRRKSSDHQDHHLSARPSLSLDLSRPRGSIDSLPPTREETSQQRPPRRRSRRPSNAESGYFPSYLAGPGGVGTMNPNVKFPGPAQDGLNKIFARHLPDVAPPKNQTDLYQPELPLDEEPLGSGAGSGIVTPSLLTQHQHSSGGGGGGSGGINIENVGGAIEAWVRRMTTKATAPATTTVGPAEGSQQRRGRQPGRRGPPGPRTSVGAPGKGTDGVGDLIEMMDEFEIEEVSGSEGRDGVAGEGGRGVDLSLGDTGTGVGAAKLRGVSGSGSGKKGGKND